MNVPFGAGVGALFSVFMLAQVAAEKGDGRLPLPDAAAEKRAHSLIREVYGKEYDTATTPTERTTLARKMLDAADKTASDPPSLYAVLRAAREMAVQAGDAETALVAADRMAQAFHVDGPATVEETLVAVANAARMSSQFRSLAEQALLRIEVAAGQDDYARAVRLGELGLAAARRAHEYPLAKEISDRLDSLKELAAAYAEVQKARAVLKEKPDDPDANLVVGRHLCVVEGDWNRGIPMLALGSDPQLRTLAAAELQAPRTPDKQVALADGWWELAESRSAAQRDALLVHAASWYEKAKGAATGLVRVKVDRRLAEIAEARSSPPAANKASARDRLPEGAVLALTFEPYTFFTEDGLQKVRDLSGHGNHGTKTGPGKAGQGLLFAAPGDFVDCGKSESLAPGEAMTVAAWIMARRWNAVKSRKNNAIVGKDDWAGSVSKGFVLRSNNKGRPNFNIGEGRGGGWKEAEAPAEMRPGVWYHLVGRFDGKSVSLIVNGVKVAAIEADKPIQPSSQPLCIGRGAYDTARRFDGIIDEVAVFNRALSDDEIKDLYQRGLRGQTLAK